VVLRMGGPLRYGFRSCLRLIGKRWRLFFLRIRKLRPDLAPIVGAEVLQPKRRLEPMELAGQRWACHPQAAKNLVEILIADTHLRSKCLTAIDREHGQRHAQSLADS